MHHTEQQKLPQNNKFWFAATIMFMFVELARPQALLPIGFLRLGMTTTLILIFCLITNKKNQIFRSRQIKLIFFFVLLVTIFVPFAINNYYAYLIARSMWLQLPFILSCFLLINSRKRLIDFLAWLVAIMIYISIYSIFHGGRGPGGVVADENDLTLFIIIILPFSFVLIYETKNIFYRLLLLTGITSSLLAIAIASSRGGFVGLLTASFIGWLYSSRKTLLFLVFLIMGSILYLYGGASFREEMSTITDTTENTAQARLLSWEAGWKMFVDNPLGVGPGNFPVKFSVYQSERFQRGMWGRVAHSLWFTLLPELGVIGIWIYFALILQNIRDIAILRKNQLQKKLENTLPKNFSIALYASFAGFFGAATFLSVLYYPHFWYLTAIVAAAKNNIKLETESSEKD